MSGLLIIQIGVTNLLFSALKEYFLTTHLQYQPFNNWYFNSRYSYGLVSKELFLDREATSSVPSGKGTSVCGSFRSSFYFRPR